MYYQSKQQALPGRPDSFSFHLAHTHIPAPLRSVVWALTVMPVTMKWRTPKSFSEGPHLLFQQGPDQWAFSRADVTVGEGCLPALIPPAGFAAVCEVVCCTLTIIVELKANAISRKRQQFGVSIWIHSQLLTEPSQGLKGVEEKQEREVFTLGTVHPRTNGHTDTCFINLTVLEAVTAWCRNAKLA